MASDYASQDGRSRSNVTTTPLGSSETYTGEWETNNREHVMVSCFSDTSGTLYFDFSNDDIRALTFPVSGFKVAAGIHEFHTAVKGARSFRVRFVNDDDAQDTLEIYTYYGENFIPANAPLNQSSSLDQDAIFTRGTIVQDEIQIGRRNGITGFTKFGYRSGLTALAGEQIIWTDSENIFTPMTTPDTYTITYNSTTDGVGTTGALSLAITHLDANGNPETFVHTLGSDGSDVTTQTGYGINRAAVSSSGSANFNTNDITITATTAATVQGHIASGNSVTEQAIFHTGFNHNVVAKWLFLKVAKLSGGGDVRAIIHGYVYNRNIETRYLVFRVIMDTKNESSLDITDPIGFNLSPSDVIYFTVDTDTNASEVDLRFSLNEYQRT